MSPLCLLACSGSCCAEICGSSNQTRDGVAAECWVTDDGNRRGLDFDSMHLQGTCPGIAVRERHAHLIPSSCCESKACSPNATSQLNDAQWLIITKFCLLLL